MIQTFLRAFPVPAFFLSRLCFKSLIKFSVRLPSDLLWKLAELGSRPGAELEGDVGGQ